MNGLLTLPLVIYVPQYMDDYIRSQSGEYGWMASVRPLAELFYWLINLGPPATSAGPLYLILALLIGSIVSVSLARTFGIRSPWWTALATLPLLGQPYYLQNLSFNFDGVLMTSGLALALLAALVAHEARTSVRIGLSILILLGSLLFYQAASSGFLAIGAALVIADWLGIPSSEYIVIRSRMTKLAIPTRMACVYIIAISLYSLITKLPLVNKDYYVEKISTTDLSSTSIAQTLSTNIKTLISVFIKDWGHSTGGLIVAFCLITCSLTLSLLILEKLRWPLSWKSMTAAVVCWIATSLALLSILALSPGALHLLKQGFAYIPRTNMFVGPWITSLNLLTLSAVGSMAARQTGPVIALRATSQVAVASMAWLILVFSFTYGSVTHSQVELQKSLISRIIGAVSMLRQLPEGAKLPDHLKVTISGPAPRSPALLNASIKFPLLNQLVPHFGLSELTWYGLSNARTEVPLSALYGTIQKSHLKTSKKQHSLGPTPTICVPSESSYCATDFEARISGDNLVIKLR
jgi:hypothetical protein